MDRYKFRAYNPESKKFLYSDKCKDLSEFFLWGERYIVEQCTGIYDRNKVPIYEGDVLTIRGTKDTWQSPVVFEQGTYYTKYKTSRYRLGGWATEAIEVIHNIHQTAEQA